MAAEAEPPLTAMPAGTRRDEERRRCTGAPPRTAAGLEAGPRNARAGRPRGAAGRERLRGARFFLQVWAGFESLPDRPGYELVGTASTAARSSSSISAARRASSFPPCGSHT